jgi:hypothetical protein
MSTLCAAPLPGEAAVRRLRRRAHPEEPPVVVARLRQALASRRPELFALQFVLTCRAKQLIRERVGPVGEADADH